jgi:tocopherol O-methyltransferase
MQLVSCGIEEQRISIYMVMLDSPKKEHIKRFYDIGSVYYSKIYGEHFHDGYYITGQEPRAEAQENLIRYLVEKAGISNGIKVLDVGCGIGGSSFWMAKNLGASTVGITISSRQVEMAQASADKFRTNSVFYLMDAETLDFNVKFDVIWAVAVCTHLENQKRFIQRATRFLNPKGVFVIYDWMLPGSGSSSDGRNLESIRRGMLLQSLHSFSEYQTWFTDNGYDNVDTKNITPFTIRTWDDAIFFVRQPAVWKLIYKLVRKEGKEVFTFVKSLNAMKTAMEKRKIISGVVIARKN